MKIPICLKKCKGKHQNIFTEGARKKEYPNDVLEKLLLEFDETDTIPFGSLLFELNTFDLDSDSLRDYTNEPQLIRKILKENSGIKVYKGDMRVFDYGEKGSDWLGIDLKRVQDPSWFSNNLVIGYVYLDSEKSSPLVEKTNREGFVENKPFVLFKYLLDYILTQFQSERRKDRDRWYRLNKKETKLLLMIK
ncbi:MAG: hypothetical protein IPL09_03270 [Bacteroidetes bacterium]|nr:hypothetical protein [Bacteroidota bacterium]